MRSECPVFSPLLLVTLRADRKLAIKKEPPGKRLVVFESKLRIIFSRLLTTELVFFIRNSFPLLFQETDFSILQCIHEFRSISIRSSSMQHALSKRCRRFGSCRRKPRNHSKTLQPVLPPALCFAASNEINGFVPFFRPLIDSSTHF